MGIKFYICDEMQKLRDYLDKHKIKWEDKSSPELPYNEFLEGHWICRIHFNVRNSKVSVIHGHGSYGGFDFDDIDGGKLEMMCELVNCGEPIDWLTSDEVIENLFGCVAVKECDSSEVENG